MKSSQSLLGFVQHVHNNQEKERHVLDYLIAKDRLEHSLNSDLDPRDFMIAADQYDEQEWRRLTAQNEKNTEDHKNEIKVSTQHLQQLGINTADMDAMGLTIERYREITRSLSINDMKTNSINPTNTNANSEESLRKLPILVIHDTEFYVDVARLQFRQVDNASNVIHLRDVQDNGDHTSIMYDLKTKNAFQGTREEMNMRSDVILVKLPATADLDFDYLMEQLSKKRDEIARQRKPSDQSITPEEKIKKSGKGQGL